MRKKPKLSWWKRVVWFLTGVIFLGTVSLYLGGGYLTGPLRGGDSAHALLHINYFYQYWLTRALWQPNHGAGLSVVGINYGAFWLPAMTARIFGWLPVQAMHFWQWLMMYLTSLGVMFLGTLALSPLAGIMAGFFFLLSHLSWIWEARIGLYAFQSSFIWVPFFFVFFHWYLKRGQKGNLFKRRLFLAAAALALALAFWFHLVTGATVSLAAFFYACLFSFRGGANLFWRLLGWLKALSLAICLSLFWWLPFVVYNQRVLAGQVDYFTFESLPDVPWQVLLGLSGFVNRQHDIWYGFFGLPVLVLAGLGVFLALWQKKRETIIFSFLSFAFFLLTMANLLWPSLVKAFLLFFSLVNTRVMLITIIFLPLVAGFGAEAGGRLIWSWLKKPVLRRSLSLLTSLLLVSFLVWQLDRLPSGYRGRCGSSYGPEADEIDFDCHQPISLAVTRAFKAVFSPSQQEIVAAPFIGEIASLIPSEDNVRADMTPRRGEYIQYWSLVSPVSLLQSSDFITKLPLDFLSYHNEAFYRGKGSRIELEQISDWFGIDYLILDQEQQEVMEKFGDWPVIAQAATIQIHRSPYSTFPLGLATHSNRPAILFFGDPGQDAYFKWWQLLVNGGLDYQEAFIADGGRRIEGFKLEDLRRFRLLVFWGEEYRKVEEANQLIKDYLEGGGKILIDTGWQYTAPWWQKEELPEWLPVKATAWQSFSQWQLQSGELGLEKIVSFWTPPRWDGQPWGASVAKKEEVRPQAIALVTDQLTGDVLAARMAVGQGEVVWTGLNLVGMYQMEDKKAARLMNLWLETAKTAQSQDFPVKVERLGPEKIEIELESQLAPSWLYWRESFYPSWQAKSGDKNKLDYYSGGPGLMLIYLPSGVAKVVLSHRYSWTIMVGGVVTILTAIGVLISLAYAFQINRQKEKKNERGLF